MTRLEPARGLRMSAHGFSWARSRFHLHEPAPAGWSGRAWAAFRFENKPRRSRCADVARPDETARGRQGLGCRGEGLPEDLAAVDGAPAQILTLAAKQVLFDFLEGELLDERSEDGARDHHGRIKRCARAP